MVTLHGDKPVVKVIDFGIAKATQGKLTDQTLFTRFEQFIGTLVYMSPEQASLSGLDIARFSPMKWSRPRRRVRDPVPQVCPDKAGNRSGREDEALKLQEERMGLLIKVNGPLHPDTISEMRRLASDYSKADREAEALKLREELVELLIKVKGPWHHETLGAMRTLAAHYSAVGREEDAEKLLADMNHAIKARDDEMNRQREAREAKIPPP